MREKDLLKAIGKINEKYLIEAQERAAKTENSDGDKQENMENIVMGVEVMSKKHTWQKVSSTAAVAAAVIFVVGAVLYIGKDRGFKEESSPGTNISTTESSSLTESITVSDTQATTESVSYEPVEVGDGIYRVPSIPPFEKVTLSCEYGTAQRSKGAQVRAYGKTMDFSSIPDEYNNDFLPYCVLDDEETVYFADYFNFYKSDIELNSPELLFNIGRDQEKFPAIINEMIAFDNTDLLFFNGSTVNGPCVGTINPETGEAEFVSGTYSMKTVPCNNGVMLYDYRENITALYWECGKIYEIPINNSNEGEVGAWVSADGEYLCTFLWGKAEDNRLIERYSVYDTKSGEFIKSFDWTFNKKVGEQLPKGFQFYNINEETKSVYVENTEDGELYQFYFGG